MKKRGILILFSACLFLVGCGGKDIVKVEECKKPIFVVNNAQNDSINAWPVTWYTLEVDFSGTMTWTIDWEVVDIIEWKTKKEINLSWMNTDIFIRAENDCWIYQNIISIKREKTEEEKKEAEKRINQYRQDLWNDYDVLNKILKDENNNDKYFRVDCIDSCKNWEVKVTLKDDEATEKRSKTSEKANMKENKIFATRYTNLMYNKTSKDFIIITHLYYKWEEVSICAWWINKYYTECYK